VLQAAAIDKIGAIDQLSVDEYTKTLPFAPTAVPWAGDFDLPQSSTRKVPILGFKVFGFFELSTIWTRQ